MRVRVRVRVRAWVDGLVLELVEECQYEARVPLLDHLVELRLSMAQHSTTKYNCPTIRVTPPELYMVCAWCGHGCSGMHVACM